MKALTQSNISIDFHAEFSSEHQVRLETFLDRHSNKLPLAFIESAGFLFAVECSPELIQPSLWLEPILGDFEFRDQEQAGQIIGALLALHRWIGKQLAEGRSPLPDGCEPDAVALGNFDKDSALSRWSRGFAYGHGWLEHAWAALVPEDDDDGAGLALMSLTFFGSLKIARNYHRQLFENDLSFDRLAKTVYDMLPQAFHVYAAAGHSARQTSSSPGSHSAEGGNLEDAGGFGSNRAH